MFLEGMLTLTLTVNTLNHRHAHEPHAPQAVYGELLTVPQGGGYTLSALAWSSLAVSGLSGFAVSLRHTDLSPS
jgi:hypothetical protein